MPPAALAVATCRRSDPLEAKGICLTDTPVRNATLMSSADQTSVVAQKTTPQRGPQLRTALNKTPYRPVDRRCLLWQRPITGTPGRIVSFDGSEGVRLTDPRVLIVPAGGPRSGGSPSQPQCRPLPAGGVRSLAELVSGVNCREVPVAVGPSPLHEVLAPVLTLGSSVVGIFSIFWPCFYLLLEELTDQVMQNPQVLAALQERLDNVSHTPSSYIETLPKAVKRRINALKQLQVKCAHIEAKFYEEVHDLERKYAALYQPLFDKRREFITGDVEPTDAESEWHSENEEEDKLAGDVKSKVVIAEKEVATAEEPNPKGIPEFWFTIFRNVDMLSELVQEYDEPILKHLQDIKVKFSDPGQPMSFVLEFHFEPNDYFTNSVLTKTYKMKSEPDKADPFSFEGPEIVDCDGCVIDWKKGKNVTVKTIRKKQKHKGRGTVRTITKQVPNDSFFNFFSPLKASGDGESLDEDSEFTLASDFEIGHFFRERIVPRAVLYFTGEAIEDDDNFEEGEEGEEEELEGDEEGEDEDDAEINPKKEPSQPSECKQQ
ncbi:nucleosome assembly protein 1-like 4 [Herpailurus yagouaroundi]|uniref:nucleosome assembly protein 1-like 4 n=1 Tax=Herpailurus yagouaroundi TaxID=1608482 RepID=UPI001AD6F31F|nr:nucleosome assembly protein 1-like 4 [Puma yagouaroundi]